MKKIFVITILFSLFISKTSMAADSDHYVKYQLEVSVPLTAALFSLVIGGEVFKRKFAPNHCRWCKKLCFDEKVRKALVWNYSEKKTANVLSNVVLASIPMIGLSELAFANDSFRTLSDGELNGFGSASLVYLETLSISLALNEVVKMVVGRERPYMRTRSRYSRRKDHDGYLSFYSGHTSTAFALAVAAATLNDMKGTNYSAAVWSVNLFLATTVGLLRIGADKHYLSDVVVGAIMGAAVGYIVPKYLHKKESGYDPRNHKSSSPFFQLPQPVMFSFGIPL